MFLIIIQVEDLILLMLVEQIDTGIKTAIDLQAFSGNVVADLGRVVLCNIVWKS